MIVAGLGCRKGSTREELLSALDAACVEAKISRESITALATGEIKREEAGILQLADMLGLPHGRVQAVATPVGGSYGGKDELTIQPIAALLA